MLLKNLAKNNQSTSLYDIVLLMAAGFLVLFVFAFLLITPKSADPGAKLKAEFVISVTWPDSLDDDIDTWVEDPNGVLTSYLSKIPKNSFVHLDRDDTGTRNETIVMANGETVKNTINSELTTIRGIVPGEYVVNLHYYNRPTSTTGPVPVMVRIQKLNPTIKTIFVTERPVELTYDDQEVTIVRFTLLPNGNVLKVATGPKKEIVTVNTNSAQP